MNKIKFLWLPVLLAAFVMPTQASAVLTGTGAELDPYIIDECTDFGDMADTSAYYEMTTDLNCGGVDVEPLLGGGTFSGHFEGGGHTIADVDVVILDETDYPTNGLFAGINGATIQNITLDDVTITVPDGDQTVGTLVGRANGNNIIDNVVVVNGDVNSGAATVVGGLIGEVSDSTGTTTVTNSSFSGDIDISPSAMYMQDIGGLFGVAGTLTLTDSFADITLNINGANGASEIGGIVGTCYSCDFDGVYSTGTIFNGANVTGLYNTGGLIGASNDSLDLTGSYSDVDMIINSYPALVNFQTLGGLIGKAEEDFAISESYYAGSLNINADGGSVVGGLIGQVSTNDSVDGASTIDQVYVEADIVTTGVEAVGGLIGFALMDQSELTITNTFINGNIYMSTGDYLAGLIAIILMEDDLEGNWLTIDSVYTKVNLTLDIATEEEVVAGFIMSLFDVNSDVVASTISNVFVVGEIRDNYATSGALFAATNGSVSLSDAYFDKPYVDRLLSAESDIDHDCSGEGEIAGCTAVNEYLTEPDRLFNPNYAPLSNFDSEVWSFSESFEDDEENDIYTSYPYLTAFESPYYPSPAHPFSILLEGEEVTGQTITTSQPTFTFSVDGPDDFDGFGYGILIGTTNDFQAENFVLVYGDYGYSEDTYDFTYTVGDASEIDGETVIKGYTDGGDLDWGEEGMELENGDYYLYLATLGRADGDPGVSHYISPMGEAAAFTVNVPTENTSSSSSGSVRSNSKSSSDDNEAVSEEELSDYEKEVQRVVDEGLVEKELDKESDKCETLMIMARALSWEYDEAVTEDGFSDTPDWCKPVAKYAKDMGYVEGRSEGLLGTDTAMNRFEFVQILFRILEGESGAEDAPYSDAIMEWAADAVNWAYAEGYMTGFADGTFGGEKGILKQDVGVVMLRIMDK